jgi:hypothetical protein
MWIGQLLGSSLGLTILGLTTWALSIYGINQKQQLQWDIPFDGIVSQVLNLAYWGLHMFTFDNGLTAWDQLSGNNWAINLAKILAPIVVFSAVFLIIQNAMRAFGLRFIWRGHSVVVGHGERSIAKIMELRSKSLQVAVLPFDKVESQINTIQSMGAHVIPTNPLHEGVFKEASLHRCRNIYLLEDGDALNIETALKMFHYLQNHKLSRNITIYLQVNQHNLVNRLTQLEPFKSSSGVHDEHDDSAPSVKLKLFNFYQLSCRNLFNKDNRNGNNTIAPPPAHILSNYCGTQRRLHAIVLGFGPMGQSVALHLAQLAHFPGGQKPQISILEYEAVEKEFFTDHYPCLNQNAGEPIHQGAMGAWTSSEIPCGFSFVEVHGEPDDELESLMLKHKDDSFMVFLCREQDQENLLLGIRIAGLMEEIERSRAELYPDIHMENKDKLESNPWSDPNRIPLYIRSTDPEALESLKLNNATNTGDSCVERFLTFGSIRDVCSYSGLNNNLDELDEIAKRIHHQYYLAEKAKEDQGLDAYVPDLWNKLREPFRNSNRYAADFMEIILPNNSLRNTHSNEIDEEQLADAIHKRWCAEKSLAGIRFGDVNSNHPPRTKKSMIEYVNLSEAEKQKDRDQLNEFRRIRNNESIHKKA